MTFGTTLIHAMKADSRSRGTAAPTLNLNTTWECDWSASHPNEMNPSKSMNRHLRGPQT